MLAQCGAMIPANNRLQVVLDASACVALIANEPATGALVLATLQAYSATGWTFWGPNVLVSEVLYALCRKHANGLLTDVEHIQAVSDFQTLLRNIQSTPGGDFELAARAEELRAGFGCSRSADGFYIALAERLAIQGQTELLTLDRGIEAQAAVGAPTVVVRLIIAP